jgi:SMC interacting uncharacterized protein involved in chromosome segregation
MEKSYILNRKRLRLENEQIKTEVLAEKVIDLKNSNINLSTRYETLTIEYDFLKDDYNIIKQTNKELENENKHLKDMLEVYKRNSIHLEEKLRTMADNISSVSKFVTKENID